MKLYELLENIDIQSEYKIVYYNELKEERVEATEAITDDSIYYDCEVSYLYVEEDILYIEVEREVQKL